MLLKKKVVMIETFDKEKMQVQANGLLNVIVSSLVERQAVEPEGALGCEVGDESYTNKQILGCEVGEETHTNKHEGKNTNIGNES